MNPRLRPRLEISHPLLTPWFAREKGWLGDNQRQRLTWMAS